MKKIVVFGASSSKASINKQLSAWAGSQIAGVEVEQLDLNAFEMPIYSSDREKEGGIPELAHKFKDLLNGADGIVISFAEHNGSYTAAFENIFDWISRTDGPTWSDKPMFLMATSPGGRGGQTVLATAAASFPHQGAQVAGTFSLPGFYENFDTAKGIVNAEMDKGFREQLELFSKALIG